MIGNAGRAVFAFCGSDQFESDDRSVAVLLDFYIFGGVNRDRIVALWRRRRADTFHQFCLVDPLADAACVDKIVGPKAFVDRRIVSPGTVEKLIQKPRQLGRIGRGLSCGKTGESNNANKITKRFLFIIIVLKVFRVTGPARRLYDQDRVAVVLGKFAARRADRISMHAAKIVRLSAFAVGYELDRSFFKTNAARGRTSLYNFTHLDCLHCCR